MVVKIRPLFLRPLFRISISLVFVYLFFLLYQGLNDTSATLIRIPTISPGLPVKLVIPAIAVDTIVQKVGVDSHGDMEVPNNITDVGWFKLGSLPGEKGSAVMSGHIDGKGGEAGVFNNLHKLRKGDRLYTYDDEGTMLTFIVRESRIYDPGYAEEVFSASDNMHLNLITCDGVWDGTKKSYSKRLVLFAEIEK